MPRVVSYKFPLQAFKHPTTVRTKKKPRNYLLFDHDKRFPNYKKVFASSAKIPLQVYKPTRATWTHKLPRTSYLYDPAVKYPIYKRLPEFWRKEYEEKMPLIHEVKEDATRMPQRSGLWKLGEFGEPIPHISVPIKVHYPPESKKGLWGGEGYIVGQRYSRGGNPKFPLYKKIWKPYVFKKTFYSEVLDRYIETTCTPLTLDMIDEAYGFDFFILKTSTKRLQEFGGQLKREMLLTLIDKKMYPDDPEMQEKIYNRYKKHLILRENAEWVGLTLQEAMQKQWDMEQANGVHDPVPLLNLFRKQLLEKIQVPQEPKSDIEVPEPVHVFEMEGKNRPESKP